MVKTFTQVAGIAQTLLGVVGAAAPGMSATLGTDMGGNVFNVLSGAALSYLGFKGNAASQKTGAQLIGAVNVVVGVLSAMGVNNIAGIPLNHGTVSMAVNLVIGAWGLYAGFASKAAAAAR